MVCNLRRAQRSGCLESGRVVIMQLTRRALETFPCMDQVWFKGRGLSLIRNGMLIGVPGGRGLRMDAFQYTIADKVKYVARLGVLDKLLTGS